MAREFKDVLVSIVATVDALEAICQQSWEDPTTIDLFLSKMKAGIEQLTQLALSVDIKGMPLGKEIKANTETLNKVRRQCLTDPHDNTTLMLLNRLLAIYLHKQAHILMNKADIVDLSQQLSLQQQALQLYITAEKVGDALSWRLHFFMHNFDTRALMGDLESDLFCQAMAKFEVALELYLAWKGNPTTTPDTSRIDSITIDAKPNGDMSATEINLALPPHVNAAIKQYRCDYRIWELAQQAQPQQKKQI